MENYLMLDTFFLEDERWMDLEDRMGLPAVAGLIRLFAWAAKYCPSGCLENLGVGEIEMAAGMRHFNGKAKPDIEPGRFFDSIIQAGFMRRCDDEPNANSYCLPDFGKYLFVVEKKSKAAG